MNNFNSLTPNDLSAEGRLLESELGFPIDREVATQDTVNPFEITSLPANLYELTQNLIVLELIGLLLGTPGSDAFVVGRPEKNDTLLTRQGNDLLLAVDPNSEHPGKDEIDVLAGDLDIFEVFPLPGITPLEENPRQWQDSFLLGDERQPYYLGSGANDYAKILDFDPQRDTIQLHGTPEDYELVETSGNTEIYWQLEAETDLVASLSGVSGLSLTEDYFQFKRDISPKTPTIEAIEQFGTSGVDLSVGIASNLADAAETGNGVHLTGASGDSFWVSKYDGNGELLWQEESPSTGNLDTDNAGNVYVGGGLGDVEIAKYDSEGKQLWTQSLGTFSLDNSFDLDVDPFGNVYLTGYTLGDLGGENAGELSAGPFPVFSTDAWLAKYDSDGNQLWLEQFGSGDFDEAFAIATDSKGNAYTSGWTLGEFDKTNAGLYDIWVAKHDRDGNQQWLKQFGSEDYDWSWDAAVDSQDNVYITGWTLGDLGATNSGSYDAWIAKYNSDGNQQWVKQFGTVGDDIARSIDIDDSGNVYLTGHTDSDLGGANSGSYDTWVAKYNSDGDRIWQQQFGSSEIDNPFALSVDSANRIFVTGFTTGSLGGVNAGAHDGWLAELSATDGSLLDFSGENSPASKLAEAEVEPDEEKNILDFTTAETQDVKFGAEADAFFDNVGGFYQAIDSKGAVIDPLSGAQIAVGDPGYEAAALANSVGEVGATDETTVEFDGGFIYVPYLLADGIEFFSAFAEANADGLNHLRTIGDRTYGFEDLLGNGDRDFNDLVISVK